MARLLVVSRSMALGMRLADVHEVVEHTPDEIDTLAPDPDVDVVLVDVGEPTAAIRALDSLRSRGHVTPVLLVSGYQPAWSGLVAVDLPGVLVVPLPITRAALLEGIATLVRPSPTAPTAPIPLPAPVPGTPVTVPAPGPGPGPTPAAAPAYLPGPPPGPEPDPASEPEPVGRPGPAQQHHPGPDAGQAVETDAAAADDDADPAAAVGPDVPRARRELGPPSVVDLTPAPMPPPLPTGGPGNGFDWWGAPLADPAAVPQPGAPDAVENGWAVPTGAAFRFTADDDPDEGAGSREAAAGPPEPADPPVEPAEPVEPATPATSPVSMPALAVDPAANGTRVSSESLERQNSLENRRALLGRPRRGGTVSALRRRLGERTHEPSPASADRSNGALDVSARQTVRPPSPVAAPDDREGSGTRPLPSSGSAAAHVAPAPTAGGAPEATAPPTAEGAPRAATAAAPDRPVPEQGSTGGERPGSEDRAGFAEPVPDPAATAVRRPPGHDARTLVLALTERVEELFGVADTAQVLADDVVERADADAAAVLVPDGAGWRVSGGVGLRPLERRLVLDSSHWVIANIAIGGQALMVEDTDIVRTRLAGAPLAAWRHLLAVPIPGVRAAVMLARGHEAAAFTERDLNAVVGPAREAAGLLQVALETRELARRLRPLAEVEPTQR